MIFPKVNKIHFVGIGGIGISALARMMIALGKKVTGSDLKNSEITEALVKEGVEVTVGHYQENVTKDIDLIIYSEAVSLENPEIKTAKSLKIPTLGYPSALGQVMVSFKERIAVSGTHGKSTVTSLVGLILEKAGFDPTVIVGSKVRQFNENFRLGKSNYFVAEGCEWKRHMLNLTPNIIVLTNIEADHLDYYKNLDEIRSAFLEYIGRLPKDGLLVLNNDDQFLKTLKLPQGKVIRYALKDEKSDLRAVNIKIKNEKQFFDLIWLGKNLGEFSLNIPGKFNIANVLAACALGLTLGVKIEVIKEVIENFRGVWRRFEILGEKNGALIVSDYAHHPTEIKETIQAAKEFYPQRRLVAIFQPHQHNRTKKLFGQFIKSFDRADLVILSEIYDVAGRESEEDQNISSKDLTHEIGKRKKEVIFCPNVEKTEEIILKNIRKNDLVLIMGAGDIYKLALSLANN